MDLKKLNDIFIFIFSPRENEESRRYDIFFLFLVAFFVLLFCSPILKNISYVSVNDEWMFFFSLNYISRMSIIKFHQLPFWTPYAGGGFPIFGYPYLGLLHPFFIFVLFFGEIIGLKIATILTYLLGSMGMYMLTRDYLNYSRIGSFFASLSYAFCSYLPSFIADGNYCHIYIFILPLIVKFFTNIKKKYLIYAAFFLMFILFQSGFLFVTAIIFLFLFSSLFGISTQNSTGQCLIKNKLKKFLQLLIITFGLSAVYIIPMLNLIERRGGPVHSHLENTYPGMELMAKKEYASLTWKQFICSLLQKRCPNTMPSMYFGYVIIMLFLASLILNWKKNYKWMIVFIFFLLLSFGANAYVDIYKILWHLHPYFHFIYKQNKYFSIGLVFIIPVITGSIFTIKFPLPACLKNFKLGIVSFLLILVFLFSLSDQFITNRTFFSYAFTKKPPLLKNNKKAFYQIGLKGLTLKRDFVNQYHYFFLVNNLGLVNWHNVLKFPEKAIPKYYVQYKEENFDYSLLNFTSFIPNPLYKGEVYFQNKNNIAKLLHFSPNKLSIGVTLNEPDILIINQNYHESWKTDHGKVENIEGLLGVNINKRGNYTVTVRYIPMRFYIGLGISALTCLFMARLSRNIIHRREIALQK